MVFSELCSLCVQGRFPEGKVEVCQPITNLQQSPPLYGVTNQDLLAEDNFSGTYSADFHAL